MYQQLVENVRNDWEINWQKQQQEIADFVCNIKKTIMFCQKFQL